MFILGATYQVVVVFFLPCIRIRVFSVPLFHDIKLILVVVV